MKILYVILFILGFFGTPLVLGSLDGGGWGHSIKDLIEQWCSGLIITSIILLIGLLLVGGTYLIWYGI